MTEDSVPKLGKLSLAILENFVKSKLGDEFVQELRRDYDLTSNVRQSLQAAEKRFLAESSDKELARVMFVDLSEQDRPSLTEAVREYYLHPTDGRFEETLSGLLLGEFKWLPLERVHRAVQFYLRLLTEELAMVDADFRAKVDFLANYRRNERLPISAVPALDDRNPKAIFQIPAMPPQGIVGREEDLDRIIESFELSGGGAHEAGLLALRGMGGIGKTTLAIGLAHRAAIQSHFRDGILWVSLGPKPTVRLLLDAWGRALGLDLQPERDETACQNRLLQELHDRQMLLIVDDVWETIPGSYFKVGGDRCRTLFTTRDASVANDLVTRERTLRLDVLNPDAALELLARLAPDIENVEPLIPARLCEKLEFLPLAITLAGRLLANESDVPHRIQSLLAELIERRQARLQLQQAEGRKGLDEESPVSLQAILGMSVERLEAADQERFAMLSLFGGEPLTWEVNAVSDVWECSVPEAETTLSRLAQRGLIEPRGDRFWMHALLADYASELMEEMDL